MGLKKFRGACGAPRLRRRIYCSELRSRSVENVAHPVLNRVGIFAHSHQTYLRQFCSHNPRIPLINTIGVCGDAPFLPETQIVSPTI